jgi:hypothetical protein
MTSRRLRSKVQAFYALLIFAGIILAGIALAFVLVAITR